MSILTQSQKTRVGRLPKRRAGFAARPRDLVQTAAARDVKPVPLPMPRRSSIFVPSLISSAGAIIGVLGAAFTLAPVAILGGAVALSGAIMSVLPRGREQ